jgi:hypothetical protein
MSIAFLACVEAGRLEEPFVASLPPLIAQAEFDKEDVSRVVPLIVATSQG